jgi:hypothetical protein
MSGTHSMADVKTSGFRQRERPARAIASIVDRVSLRRVVDSYTSSIMSSSHPAKTCEVSLIRIGQRKALPYDIHMFSNKVDLDVEAGTSIDPMNRPKPSKACDVSIFLNAGLCEMSSAERIESRSVNSGSFESGIDRASELTPRHR